MRKNLEFIFQNAKFTNRLAWISYFTIGHLRSKLKHQHYYILVQYITQVNSSQTLPITSLEKSAKFNLTNTHENCFFEVKSRIAKATANCHYNPQLETRVKCNASRAVLSAASEQLTEDGGKPIALLLDL